MFLPLIDYDRVYQLISLALIEDLDETGDTTTIAVVPENILVSAILRCKEDCVCAGLSVAERVFKAIDESIEFECLVADGDYCPAATLLAKISGNARALLTAERTALNFIQRLSGIATTARRYMELVVGTQTVILDTRKTTPGWRNLEKYAVAVGGASNHRIGLYDRIMIKDNHRELAGMEGSGGIARSVRRAREIFPELEVEVEADTLDEVREAIEAEADYILLDNMSNEQMAQAVSLNSGQARLEASGGITLERIPAIARLGVDFISVGALTHSVKATDISMEIEI
ncbi:MAG: carboxylating nicotinate-nucleotide diphosphorylase [Victivallaceae bacterium]|nr:carboxylating nicotinate-nucleotide diphosphorylase [Victivallaceae bacterium]